MTRPLGLDARNMLPPVIMNALGFEYHSFGRPDLSPSSVLVSASASIGRLEVGNWIVPWNLPTFSLVANYRLAGWQGCLCGNSQQIGLHQEEGV
jgi:hypothetical protein